MPVVADTAYPRLAANPRTAELEEAFTPTEVELLFASQRTRRAGPRLALLVLLKTFQRLGYFVLLADVPLPIVSRIASTADLCEVTEELVSYDSSTYRVRLTALVRDFVGVAGYDRSARAGAVQAALQSSRTRDDLTDIVNAAIEELVRQRYELPAFGTLLKIARTARAYMNRGYHRRIVAAMTPEARERLAALLVVPDGAARSPWDQVKAEPLRPSPQRMREFLVHLQWLRGQEVGGVFAGVPDQKVRQFAAEAKTAQRR